ncbi:MAG TPA: lamin tail domain-containing protein [Chitinophagales bacterium]|nr:lamin tail domain-containing protein [Chitinophagales bacterium]
MSNSLPSTKQIVRSRPGQSGFPGKKIYLLILFAAAVTRLNAQCSELFISEYIEGLSFDKAIEIYNPTSDTVNLAGYRLETYFNGNDTAGNHVNLNGLLAPNDVYVVIRPGADTSILLQEADTISLVCNFNGDDAVALINTITGVTLDVVGVIGEDPGTAWPVDTGTGTTNDYTLVRIPSVQSGTTDWSVGSTQWIVYPVNDFSHLGAHTMTPCNVTAPSLYFLSDSVSVDESAGSISFLVGITNPNANSTSVDVSVSGGTAVDSVDYIFSSPQTITFPANSSTPLIVDVTIINDLLSELDETIEMSLSNPTNQGVITNGSFIITIIDDDGLSIGKDVSSAAVKIFPTVSSGIFTVNSEMNSTVSVSDIFGNEIWKKNDVQGNMKPDLQAFAKGIYFIAVENAEGKVVKKVIMQ